MTRSNLCVRIYVPLLEWNFPSFPISNLAHNNQHDIEYLMELLARRKINPVVEKRVTLDAVPFTQQQLEAGEIEGLVVCKPWK